MELKNEFAIDRPIDQTWKVLTDLEFIAPCMPGAQLTEIEGEEYRGLVKVKVGPISANYKGRASFIEQDNVNYVARLKAEGRDPLQGNANAIVTAKMIEVGGNRTNVSIHTDLGLSGKIASFGRRAIEDVSKKILGQFTDNLRKKLELEGGTELFHEPLSAVTEPPTALPGQPITPVSRAGSVRTARSNGDDNGSATSIPTITKRPPMTKRPTVRKIDGPEAEPVDLVAASRTSVLKRVLPAGGVIAILLFIWWAVAGR